MQQQPLRQEYEQGALERELNVLLERTQRMEADLNYIVRMSQVE